MDWLSKKGAEELERRIRKYWRDKGFRIETRVEESMSRESFFGTDRTLFGVRSNLIDGYPPTHWRAQRGKIRRQQNGNASS
jgi:hypothetical protein